jgi:hypothetical protein
VAAGLIAATSVPITHFAPPSSFAVPASRSIATGTLQRLAFVIVASHAVFLGLTQWLLLEQFLGRALTDVAQPAAMAFRQYTLHVYGAEVVALAAAAAAAFGVRLVLGHQGNGRRVAVAGLLAYAPLTFYSAIVLLALMMGWQPDVWLMSAPDATDSDIAATLREALPVVLQPLLPWRHLATIIAAITFGALQRRLCRIGIRHAAITAAAAGAAALFVQLLMLGMPGVE